MEIIRPSTDLMLESAAVVDSLCQPLKKIGATFFSLTRIFDDGSRIDLNNNSAMAEEFYYGSDRIYSSYVPEVNTKNLPTNLMLLDYIPINPTAKFLRDFNIDHMAVEIDKHNDYCDVWNYGSQPENVLFYSDFFKQKSIVQNFKQYFLEKASALIQECEKDKIYVCHHHNAYTNLIMNPPDLSKIEMRCCQLLAQGLSRTKISKMLFRSPRTIDAHIQNIRKKLHFQNTHELIMYLPEFFSSRATNRKKNYT